MSMQTTRADAQRIAARKQSLGSRGGSRRLATGFLVAAALGGGPALAAAQSAIGVPFIGNNHLSFYSTELTSDGVGTAMSTLYGGRYAHLFGDASERTRLSVIVQGAARDLEGGSAGVLDASITAAWTRRMDEVDGRLSATVAAGANALVWGVDEADGVAHVSLPVSVGVGYDLKIGSATVTPFVKPGIAYYRARSYLNDVRVGEDRGWDGLFTAGASLRLRELVLTTSRIRGEQGLPHRSRWAFAAGISF